LLSDGNRPFVHKMTKQKLGEVGIALIFAEFLAIVEPIIKIYKPDSVYENIQQETFYSLWIMLIVRWRSISTNWYHSW